MLVKTMSMFRSPIIRAARYRSSQVVSSQRRSNSSVEGIAAQQHSGSRSAPRPTKETGTSTQAPHESAKSQPPEQQELPESHQQKAPEQEDGEEGSTAYMAHTDDKQGGQIKSNSPFRAAPVEKKIGAKTIAPDLEANERSANK